MGNKPAILANLQTGKLIDTQSNFVDTFNWMKDFCNNIEGKEPLKVNLDNDNKPIIEFNNPETIDVISDISFKIENNKLVAEITKKKVVISAKDDSTTTTEVEIASGTQMNICVGNEYSPSTHVFRQFMIPALVLEAGETTNSVVFTAASHAEEHNQ